MIRAMLQDVRTNTLSPRRGLARPKGVWEVFGILAAIVPCGILAGLYLATEDARFLVGCIVLAVLAAAIVFVRHPGAWQPQIRHWLESLRQGSETGGSSAGSILRRTVNGPVLKVLGFAAWMMAWGVTAALYARVAVDVNPGALVMLVVIGGFSPVVIYFGLEGGIRTLKGRRRDD
jgi:hypothetical protein